MSPYQVFYNWLFDGQSNTPIPPPKNDIDLLKYNSPITNTFILSLFMKNGKLNHYLNKYFNNINLRYITRQDMFIFIKKCVIDFKVKRRDIIFYKFSYQEKLYTILRDKFPQFKNDDIKLLSEMINKSKEKDIIWESLGLKLPKKKKVKRSKKKISTEIISLKNFISEHFSST